MIAKIKCTARIDNFVRNIDDRDLDFMIYLFDILQIIISNKLVVLGTTCVQLTIAGHRSTRHRLYANMEEIVTCW